MSTHGLSHSINQNLIFIFNSLVIEDKPTWLSLLWKRFFPDIPRTQASNSTAISHIKFCSFSVPLRAGLVPLHPWEESKKGFKCISNKVCSVQYLKYVIVWAKSIIEIILALLSFPGSLFSITHKDYMMLSSPQAYCRGAAGGGCSTEESSKSESARRVQGWQDTVPPCPTRKAEQGQWCWWWPGSDADQG